MPTSNTSSSLGKWRKLGTLFLDENGNFKLKPVKILAVRKPIGVGKIADPPTPRDVRISKEKKKDYSLEGRLKEIKEKQK